MGEGGVAALVASPAGCPSPSGWGVGAAALCGVASVAGGSVRRPRRRMNAAVAARAPAAPVRSAARRFFPAPRESSRLRPDVRSPNTLPRLAGNPGLRFARGRLGRRRAPAAAGRNAGRLRAPPGSATSRLEGVRLCCRRGDGRRAASLVGICSPLRGGVGGCLRLVGFELKVAAGFESSVALAVKPLAGRPTPRDSQPTAAATGVLEHGRRSSRG